MILPPMAREDVPPLLTVSGAVLATQRVRVGHITSSDRCRRPVDREKKKKPRCLICWDMHHTVFLHSCRFLSYPGVDSNGCRSTDKRGPRRRSSSVPRSLQLKVRTTTSRRDAFKNSALPSRKPPSSLHPPSSSRLPSTPRPRPADLPQSPADLRPAPHLFFLSPPPLFHLRSPADPPTTPTPAPLAPSC